VGGQVPQWSQRIPDRHQVIPRPVNDPYHPTLSVMCLCAWGGGHHTTGQQQQPLQHAPPQTSAPTWTVGGRGGAHHTYTVCPAPMI
jgi:hypothetical protein